MDYFTWVQNIYSFNSQPVANQKFIIITAIINLKSKNMKNSKNLILRKTKMERRFCIARMAIALGLLSASPLMAGNSSGTNLLSPYSVNKQQTKKITGVIVDAKGTPIIGASIKVKGNTSRSTINRF